MSHACIDIRLRRRISQTHTQKKTKLAPYGTEGRLLTSDVSANFKVT